MWLSKCDKIITNEEKNIKKGGIDIQLFDIGRNGYFGFIELDAKFEAKTHLVNLDKDTVWANLRLFSAWNYIKIILKVFYKSCLWQNIKS